MKSSRTQAVIDMALQLPETDRAFVVEELLQSLTPEDDAEVDAAWAEELDRRCNELDEGTATLFSWDEVKELAERRLRDSR